MVLSASARSAVERPRHPLVLRVDQANPGLGIRHAADGGAEADDVAEGGGIAQRTAGVRAAGDGHHAAGEGDGGASG